MDKPGLNKNITPTYVLAYVRAQIANLILIKKWISNAAKLT